MMRATMAGGAAALVLALALAPTAALAQDDMMDSMVPHPSHIHAGACPAPGEIVANLSDVGPVANDAQGAADHIHVDVGLSSVDLPLADILAAEHAFVVHASVDDMATYIACGNIGGHDADGSFVVGLGPVADSGYSGIAWLTDNGDGTTGVSVAITHSGAVTMDDMSDDMDDETEGADDSDG